MAEINDKDSNIGKSEIDFTELDGQLELIVQHLEKRDKKKAVSYYLKESTIERIKMCAQNFNMKDSQFLEEAINKLIDVIENRNQQAPSEKAIQERAIPERAEATEAIRSSEEKELSGFSEKQIVTPWGRLTEVKRAAVANQSTAVNQPTVASEPTIVKQVSVNSIQADVNAKSGVDTGAYVEANAKSGIGANIEANVKFGADVDGANADVSTKSGIDADVEVIVKSGADTSAEVNVQRDVEETEQVVETTKPAVSVAANDPKQLEQLEATLIDYIINNYRQDYRMLYRRFEQIIQSELSIEPHILIELVRKLDRQGELTYYAKQNLIDINKKLFEARVPNLKENFKYYEDDDFIE